MIGLSRDRLLALALAAVIGLGGIVAAFSTRMPTLDDLAAVTAMAAGATDADLCGGGGKSVFAGVKAQLCHGSAGSILPGHRPTLLRVMRPAAEMPLPVPPVLAGHRPDPGHASRAPPARIA